jgi:hypothetical protein
MPDIHARFASALALPLALALAAAASASCKREEKFPPLDDQIASPVDVAASADGERFYVLNADFDRTYNVGSVLVLDADGEKVGSVEVPRMGRTLNVAGDDMIVTVDFRDDGEGPEAILFDLSGDNRDAPVERARWDLPCSPYNVVMHPGYRHFALACVGGTLMMGTLEDDRSASELKSVRSYGTTRRALHLDPARELLFGFTTDASKQDSGDAELIDTQTFDENAKEIIPEGAEESDANEVPDVMESTRRALSNKGQRNAYQFFVFDLAAERDVAEGCEVTDDESCVFPFRENTDPVVQRELRWIYFKLANFDGTPDGSSHEADPNYKYYRTNFYDAKPDPEDPDTFYLSHRGKAKRSPHSNQIVRVHLDGDPRVSDGKVPRTEDVMSFERVYGFKGAEVSKESYPGDFELASVGGQKLLVVNHFRDLVNWLRSDTYFSLGAKTLDDESLWFTEIQGSLSGTEVTSYFQVAVTDAGKAVSCSFYGNAVLLLEVVPGVGIRELKRIE